MIGQEWICFPPKAFEVQGATGFSTEISISRLCRNLDLFSENPGWLVFLGGELLVNSAY